MKDFNPNIIIESFYLGVENPVRQDPKQPINEAAIADLHVKDVRAIYPMVRAINSGRLTRNKTFYPAESLIGKKKATDPTGYASFVMPDPKPVVKEHNLQGGFFNPPDKPMGRLIYGTFVRAKKGESKTAPNNPLEPGTVEGDGCMKLIPVIAQPEHVIDVLSGALHTVSIGSSVEKIIESVSGLDIALLRRQGKELPPFEKGMVYTVDGKDALSWWRMGDIRGMELSFVNVPSDIRAGVEDTDIGENGIKLLLGEKKPGSDEFSFFDAMTLEKVLTLSSEEHYAFAPSFELVDSMKLKEYYWVDKYPEGYKQPETEKVNESAEDDKSVKTKEVKPEVGDILEFDDSTIGLVLTLKGENAVVRLCEAVTVDSETDYAAGMSVVMKRVYGGSKVIKRRDGSKPEGKPEMQKEPDKQPGVKTKQRVKYMPKIKARRENHIGLLAKASQEYGQVDLKELTLSELSELKTFFLEKFNPSQDFAEKSEYSAPLLELKASEDWTVAQHEWAWLFRQADEKAEDIATRASWGLPQLSGESAERLIGKIITEVLKL